MKHLLVLLAAIAVAGSVSAQEVTLKISDSLPSTHFLARNGVTYFIEEVEKRSEGRIKFDYFPAEQLGGSRQLLDLTQKGVTDIGMVASSYASEKMPLSSVFELPGGFPSSCAGTIAYWELTRDGEFLAENEMNPLGVRLLFAYVNPPYQLFTSQPLTSFDDLSGLKIRAGSGSQELMLRSYGAAPVKTVAVEIYEALSRGTVDGMIFPPPTALVYETEKFIKSYTQEMNFGSVPVGYLINDKVWNGLPDDLKAVLNEVGEETTRRICKLTDRDTAVSFEKFAAVGAERFVPSEEEVAKLNKVLSEVSDKWVDRLDERGLKGRAAYEAFVSAVANVDNAK